RPPSASATTAAMPAAEHQRASRVSGGTGTRIVSWMVWRVAERMAQRPFDLEESGAHAAGGGESCVRAWEEPSGGLAPSPPPRGDRRGGRKRYRPCRTAGTRWRLRITHRNRPTRQSRIPRKIRISASVAVFGSVAPVAGGGTGCALRL